MGNISSVKKVGFEDVQKAIKMNYIMINTMSIDTQNCLILNTIPAHLEEEKINDCIKKGKNINIIIYGKNTNDEKVVSKYKQLLSYGFKNVYIYLGGMFEWMILQDIYGKEEFPTNGTEKDILKYKPEPLL
jgi:23S rRNA pseudoU1915 N3-methylase RlmH